MKVTVITSSAHRRGTTALLADEFIKGATEAGHEVRRFDAAGKDIHQCIGCNACHTKGRGCVFKDDMETLNPLLLDADVLVLVSPIYYYNVCGQLKTVIDCFFANNEALMGGKKAVLLTSMADTSAESAEAAQVFFRHLTQFMKWQDAGVLSTQGTWTRESMEQSGYPKQAYDLGRSL